MAWFTPVFFVAPPPPPAPAPVYRTYVPAPPVYRRRSVVVRTPAAAAVRPGAAPVRAAAAPKPEVIPAGVPAALRQTVYLSKHRQTSVQSILTVIAAQIGYRADFRVSRNIPAPHNAGLVWMSDPQQGATAFQQLASLGGSLHRMHEGSIQIDPNTKTITLLPPESR